MVADLYSRVDARVVANVDGRTGGRTNGRTNGRTENRIPISRMPEAGATKKVTLSRSRALFALKLYAKASVNPVVYRVGILNHFSMTGGADQP